MPEQRTKGLSPKVWVPVAVGILAIATQWLITGEFDRVETGQTILTAGYAVIGFLAGPGFVVDKVKR